MSEKFTDRLSALRQEWEIHRAEAPTARHRATPASHGEIHRAEAPDALLRENKMLWSLVEAQGAALEAIVELARPPSLDMLMPTPVRAKHSPSDRIAPAPTPTQPESWCFRYVAAAVEGPEACVVVVDENGKTVSTLRRSGERYRNQATAMCLFGAVQQIKEAYKEGAACVTLYTHDLTVARILRGEAEARGDMMKKAMEGATFMRLKEKEKRHTAYHLASDENPARPRALGWAARLIRDPSALL